MNKSAVLAITASIIIGFTILGVLIYFGLINSQKDTARYKMVSHGNTIIIFDQNTGTYWQKFLSQGEGPTDWREFECPIK